MPERGRGEATEGEAKEEAEGKKRRDVGAEKCATACWDMTASAMDACRGFRFAGGWLIDDWSRARCPICRSFVFYAPQHPNTNLANKCFAITAHSWAPAYEPHVTSGLFNVSLFCISLLLVASVTASV